MTTAVFIHAWARLDTYSPTRQYLVKYLLVQGHLATENVVAAWYSSMLLLTVCLLAAVSYAADRRRGAGPLRYGWLLMGTVFLVLSVDEIGSFHERVGMVRALGGSEESMGWAYVLAGPIALVALFLVAFAWLHVRTIPTAFWLLALGVGLFAVNPLFERLEMALIHGGTQSDGTPRLTHDVLLVVEEGVLELFGTLCFASAVLAYVGTVTGGRFEWRVRPPRALAVIVLLTAILTAGVPASRFVVARLPPGDTGIAANWFPAAAFLLLAAACGLADATAANRRRLRIAAVLALGVSAYFGAGLYGYTDWGIDVMGPHIPMAGTLAAGAAAACLVRAASSDPEPSQSAAGN